MQNSYFNTCLADVVHKSFQASALYDNIAVYFVGILQTLYKVK